MKNEMDISQNYLIDDENWKPTNKTVADLVTKLNKFGWNHYDVETIVCLQHGWMLAIQETVGGCEGDGNEFYIIIKLTNSANEVTYWKIPGYYESYNGTEIEWGNTYQVKPVEVPVIQWHPI